MTNTNYVVSATFELNDNLTTKAREVLQVVRDVEAASSYLGGALNKLASAELIRQSTIDTSLTGLTSLLSRTRELANGIREVSSTSILDNKAVERGLKQADSLDKSIGEKLLTALASTSAQEILSTAKAEEASRSLEAITQEARALKEAISSVSKQRVLSTANLAEAKKGLGALNIGLRLVTEKIKSLGDASIMPAIPATEALVAPFEALAKKINEIREPDLTRIEGAIRGLVTPLNEATSEVNSLSSSLGRLDTKTGGVTASLDKLSAGFVSLKASVPSGVGGTLFDEDALRQGAKLISNFGTALGGIGATKEAKIFSSAQADLAGKIVPHFQSADTAVRNLGEAASITSLKVLDLQSSLGEVLTRLKELKDLAGPVSSEIRGVGAALKSIEDKDSRVLIAVINAIGKGTAKGFAGLASGLSTLETGVNALSGKFRDMLSAYRALVEYVETKGSILNNMTPPTAGDGTTGPDPYAKITQALKDLASAAKEAKQGVDSIPNIRAQLSKMGWKDEANDLPVVKVLQQVARSLARINRMAGLVSKIQIDTSGLVEFAEESEEIAQNLSALEGSAKMISRLGAGFESLGRGIESVTKQIASGGIPDYSKLRVPDDNPLVETAIKVRALSRALRALVVQMQKYSEANFAPPTNLDAFSTWAKNSASSFEAFVKTFSSGAKAIRSFAKAIEKLMDTLKGGVGGVAPKLRMADVFGELSQLNAYATVLQKIAAASRAIGRSGVKSATSEYGKLNHPARTSGSNPLEDRAAEMGNWMGGLMDDFVSPMGKKFTYTLSKMESMSQDISGNFSEAGMALAGPLIEAVHAATALEAEMTNVRKVYEEISSQEAFDRMTRDISLLSTMVPVTAEELAKIAAQSAATAKGLNPGKTGLTQEILAMTRDAARMAVAFDMAPKDAAQTMFSLRTIFKLTQTEVTELADSVNYLSNNMNASASNVSLALNRLAGTAQTVGLAAKETAALSATMVQLKVAPQTAARAMSALLSRLSSIEHGTVKAKEAVRALGYTSDKELGRMMRASPQKTLIDILQRFKAMGSANIGLVRAMFGQEHMNAIMKLIGAVDQYKQAINLSTSVDAVNSVLKEFRIRANTTENALIFLNNSVRLFSLAAGQALIPAVKFVAHAMATMAKNIATVNKMFPLFLNFTVTMVASIAALALGIGAITGGVHILAMLTMGITSLPGAIAIVGSALSNVFGILKGIALLNVATSMKSMWVGLSGMVVRFAPLIGIFTVMSALIVGISTAIGAMNGRINSLSDVGKELQRNWQAVKDFASYAYAYLVRSFSLAYAFLDKKGALELLDEKQQILSQNPVYMNKQKALQKSSQAGYVSSLSTAQIASNPLLNNGAGPLLPTTPKTPKTPNTPPKTINGIPVAPTSAQIQITVPPLSGNQTKTSAPATPPVITPPLKITSAGDDDSFSIKPRLQTAGVSQGKTAVVHIGSVNLNVTGSKDGKTLAEDFVNFLRTQA